MNILITNAKIFDGTGNPWFRGDLEIHGDVIRQVERKLSIKADKTIDADGLAVAPGFIDPHCHLDGPAIFHPEMEGPLTQGITSEVLGMCGTSPYPDRETYLDFLSKVYGGDVFWYSKMYAKSSYHWHSLTEYCNLVMSRLPGINIVPFIGLGTILWKVGYRVTTESEVRRLTIEEVKAAKDLIREGFDQGAVGLTTSRDYYPDRYLDVDDYVEPLKVVTDYNRLFDPHTKLLATPDGVKEAVAIAKKTGAKIHISHLNACPNMNYGNINSLPECLGVIESARQEGIDITFDVIQNMSYCYGPGSSIRQLRYFCREWSSEPLEGLESLEQFRKNAQRREYREKVKELVIKYVGRAEQYLKDFFNEHLDTIFIIKTGDNRLEGKTLGKIAKEIGTNPRDLYFDIAFGVSPLLANSPNAVIIWPFTAGHPNEENVIEASNHPLGMPSSDYPVLDSPVEFFYSPSPYSTMPLFYRRALDRGIKVEEAIRKMTSLPARVLGLSDRGVIKEGMKADLVVFDPVEYRSAADYYNPTARAPGVQYVIVNGRLVIDDGKLTNERPGKVLLRKRNNT